MNNSIIIRENSDGLFSLQYGIKRSINLSYGDMIGLVAQLAIDKECTPIGMMLTSEQIHELEEWNKKEAIKERVELLKRKYKSILISNGIEEEDINNNKQERKYTMMRAIVSCCLLDDGFSSLEISGIINVKPSTIRYYKMKSTYDKKLKIQVDSIRENVLKYIK